MLYLGERSAMLHAQLILDQLMYGLAWAVPCCAMLCHATLCWLCSVSIQPVLRLSASLLTPVQFQWKVLL